MKSPIPSGSREPSSDSADAALFVSGLAQEALCHRAVNHPYLEALARGSLPDPKWALSDFAHQYYGYSSHFPRYLTLVISRLERPAHRKALLENLTQETGVYDEHELAQLDQVGIAREWIVGVDHPRLFQRFCHALGVELAGEIESDQVVCWRELFLALLGGGSPAEAVGALGLGTENIVRKIYGPLVKAIRRLNELSPRDTVFFPLHTVVDDDHQANLQAIAADFAGHAEARIALRRGMLKALQLRSAFWDWLYQRALAPGQASGVL